MIPATTETLPEALWEITSATEPIALISQYPDELGGNVVFRLSYDDLDELWAAILPGIADNEEIALISHRNAPVRGIQICVAPGHERVPETILYLTKALNLPLKAIAWVHPDHEQAFSDLVLHNSRFPLSRRMSEFLGDAGLPIEGTLSLDDIFIYPELEREHDDTAKPGRILGKALFLSPGERRRILITGDEQSGKTTLLKMLFKHYYAQGAAPILLTRKTIDGDGASESVERTFGLEYSRSLYAQYKLLPPSRRIVLVDDLFLFPPGLAQRLVAHLESLADIIVIVADDILFGADPVLGGKTYDRYKLLPMRHRLRNDLIRKWILLSGVRSREERSLRWARATKTIDTVIGLGGARDGGRAYVPAYPIYLLALLRAQDRGAEVGAGPSPSALGYFYELLIKLSLADGSDIPTYDVFASYLAHLAFAFFERDISEANREQMDAILSSFEDIYGITRHADTLLNALIQRRLLKKRVDNRTKAEWYSFRYPFVYYYFVAAYFRDHIDHPAYQHRIKAMATNMADAECAHILLFLAHVTRSQILQDTLLEAARLVYPDLEPATLETSPSPGAIRRISYVDRGTIHGQDIMAEEIDAREMRAPHSATDDGAPLVAALRTLRVVGQVLRNFPGSLEKERKISLGRACVGIAKRTLAVLLEYIQENRDQLRAETLSMVRYYHQDFAEARAQRRANRAIQQVAEVVSYSMVKRLSYSIGADDLEKIWSEIFGGDGASTIDELFNVSVELDRTRRIQREIVDRAYRRVSNNPLALSVLRRLVTLRFELFEDDFRLKQSLCATLGIDYKILQLRRYGAKTEGSDVLGTIE